MCSCNIVRLVRYICTCSCNNIHIRVGYVHVHVINFVKYMYIYVYVINCTLEWVMVCVTLHFCYLLIDFNLTYLYVDCCMLPLHVLFVLYMYKYCSLFSSQVARIKTTQVYDNV